MKTDKGYLAGHCQWNYIGIDEDPPLGTKVWLLTEGGMAVEGNYTDKSNYIAWSPMLKRNKSKEWLQRAMKACEVKPLAYSHIYALVGGASIKCVLETKHLLDGKTFLKAVFSLMCNTEVFHTSTSTITDFNQPTVLHIPVLPGTWWLIDDPSSSNLLLHTIAGGIIISSYELLSNFELEAQQNPQREGQILNLFKE